MGCPTEHCTIVASKKLTKLRFLHCNCEMYGRACFYSSTGQKRTATSMEMLKQHPSFVCCCRCCFDHSVSCDDLPLTKQLTLSAPENSSIDEIYLVQKR